MGLDIDDFKKIVEDHMKIVEDHIRDQPYELYCGVCGKCLKADADIEVDRDYDLSIIIEPCKCQIKDK